jgi:hypothetical protein
MRVAFWRKMGTRSKFLVPVHSFPAPKRPPGARLLSPHPHSQNPVTAAHPRARHRCLSPPPPPPHRFTPLPFPIRSSTTAAPLHHFQPRHPLDLCRPFKLRLSSSRTERGRALAPLSAPVHHRCPSPPPWPPHPSAFSQILPRHPILAASPPPPAHLNSRHHHWCSRIPSSWCSRIPSSSTSSSANQWRHNPS